MGLVGLVDLVGLPGLMSLVALVGLLGMLGLVVDFSPLKTTIPVSQAVFLAEHILAGSRSTGLGYSGNQ